jgi:hypothetical protein
VRAVQNEQLTKNAHTSERLLSGSGRFHARVSRPRSVLHASTSAAGWHLDSMRSTSIVAGRSRVLTGTSVSCGIAAFGVWVSESGWYSGAMGAYPKTETRADGQGMSAWMVSVKYVDSSAVSW